MPTKPASSIVLENNQPIPPQRQTHTTANYSVALSKLKKGQCYRIKDKQLYELMAVSARRQNGTHGAGYVCRWLGSFGRIWQTKAKPSRPR